MMRDVGLSGVAEGGTARVGSGVARDAAVGVGVSDPTGEQAASHNARRVKVRRMRFMNVSSRGIEETLEPGGQFPQPQARHLLYRSF